MSEEKNNQVDMNFFNIVMSLSQSALMYMGKITNPHSGKVEKNLELVQANIDILQMLQYKTKGNLTKKEKEVLNENLTNLQLTYADEKKKDSEEAEEQKKDSEQEENKK